MGDAVSLILIVVTAIVLFSKPIPGMGQWFNEKLERIPPPVDFIDRAGLILVLALPLWLFRHSLINLVKLILQGF